MRTGAAAGHLGYYHESICYDSDEHFLAVAVPFLAGGVAAGEPTIVSMGAEKQELLRSALPAGLDVTFLSGGAMYARPAAAIRSYRKMLAGHVAGGATQIRIVGELAPELLGVTWDSWARYESAINHAYDDFPLWSMCAYDTRVTPAPVLADVLRTHPRTALPGDRHVANATYTEPVPYLSDPRPPVPDPLQRTEPLTHLTDPTLAGARRAVRAADQGRLPQPDVDDFLVAVTEAVANAQRHGVGPVHLRLWAADDRLVVSVTDAGAGPDDPFAGLLPAGDGRNGGLGMWIAHQSCNHVAHYRHAGGFTMRLTAGNPYH